PAGSRRDERPRRPRDARPAHAVGGRPHEQVSRRASAGDLVRTTLVVPGRARRCGRCDRRRDRRALRPGLFAMMPAGMLSGIFFDGRVPSGFAGTLTLEGPQAWLV